MIWHSATAEDVIKELKTDSEKGLSTIDASKRLNKHGKNLTVNEEEISIYDAFIDQLKKPSIILLACLLIIFILKELVVGSHNFIFPVAMVLLICIKAALCIYSEYRSRNMLASLGNRMHVTAKVVRGGKTKTIKGEDLVPGDIIILTEGDYVPADARLIESNGLRCDESVLYNEKEVVVVNKEACSIFENHVPVTQRENMVYCGCHIITGDALAVITETGADAEIRRSVIKDKIFIHKGVQDRISDRYNDLLKIFKFASLAACVIITALGTFATKGSIGWGKFLEALIAAVAFYIAVVPGSLSTRIASLFVLGIKRLEKDNAVIFNPLTIEKLAGVSVICSDKTGTLTQNKMSLVKVYDGEKIIDLRSDTVTKQSEVAMRFGALSCDVEEDGEIADHTENALVSASSRYLNIGKSDLDEHFPRITCIALTPERKIKTTVNMIEGKVFCIVRGAPDIILERCNSNNSEEIRKHYEELCSDGYRVLAIAYKILDSVPAEADLESLEYNLEFLGLFGISDRERKGVANDIALCKRSGISTVMFTGDHINTASSIAQKIGILSEEDLAVTGEQTACLSDDELAAVVNKIKVCARFSSDDRIRMVNALHRNGEKVLLTADSAANYAPMSYAEVGCAMGKTGTNVAKGNADIVVYDDSFTSIVKAIRNARGIFNNFTKYTNYYMAMCACMFVVMTFGTILFGTLFPSAPLVLLGAIFALVFPIAAIGYETADVGVMNVPPRSIGDKMFDVRSIVKSAITGAIIAIVPIVVAIIKMGHSGAQTATFMSLVFTLIYFMFSTRSADVIYKRLFHNRFMFIIAGICVLATIIIVATPIRVLFGIPAADSTGWLTAILIPITIPAVFEALKFLKVYKSI